ncbi:CheR family methyltransferase [Pedobacter cryoconitis]|uniref:Two-component system CheB/CheR fusion protein n=1 Tax=Pedobacter cryoconitis TaxID=188932 RepID=A0A327T8G1_9SPHI|nr:CheR family methyltransferase [Pedobacter cryoconitis]RAJ37212.1 two-component system CheB/CheR fusion protein [Pedobacter cryoconitis]
MAINSNKQYIIAIGASAGGLDAISAFFDYTPLDGVSYIVIQHLSPDFKSQMVQLLSRHSKLHIAEATHGIQIESNKVYLIPSSDFMQVKDGRLLLSDKKDKPRPHMTIDHFFISLAKEQGNKAIAVILSGSGNDGTKGAEAIRKAGGIVIAQDPATAAYKEMPMAVIASNSVDNILSPKDMPRYIEAYVKEGEAQETIYPEEEEISENGHIEIINLIKDTLPFDFTDYKHPTIIRRVKRRMEQQHIDDVAKYYAFLQQNPEEIELLANDFLIGVTCFFRDPDAFAIVEEKVIKDIIDHKEPGDVIKIWVAGCSTGEEAYSLAILLREYLDKKQHQAEVKIFATDISKSALEFASKGVYTQTLVKGIRPDRLKFFTREGEHYKVKPEIRKMLIFAHHDLAKNPPYCNIDLISCRNLLIYMNASLQKKVFSMMYFGLKKDGYLFLGPSESAAILQKNFSEISSKWNILKRNKNGSTIRFDIFPSPVIEGIKNTTMEISKKTIVPLSKFAVSDEINKALLEEAGFRGVCTDENLKVIYSFGDPAVYLKNELFNFDLNDLIPDHLAIAFKAAAHKALKQNQRIILKNLEFELEEKPVKSTVDLVIKPFLATKSSTQLLLVLFLEQKNDKDGDSYVMADDISPLTKEYVTNLENELAEAKHQLEVAHDWIASSNENMQSFNEELLSANEEMQSANEELQSLNEELQTINKEQHYTNTELAELNDDLNNYFRSNLNGQLFVDHDLLLKKFSPSAVEHINIRDSDIGRPLSNITTNIRMDGWIDDIKEVMYINNTIVREARSEKGKIYQIMTMPYIRKNSTKASGAVISFYDITELKTLASKIAVSNEDLLKKNEEITEVNAELLERNEQLSNSKQYTEEIFNTIHDPLVILDKELKVLRASEGFFHMFKVKEEETKGAFLYDLGNKQWDIPALRNQLDTILPQKGNFKAFEVDHVFNLIGRRIIRLTARQFDTHNQEKLILLALHDITDKRKVEEGLAVAERLLAESKERLHFAIESAGIGAWDFNPLTNELIWDNRCKELFGLVPGDYVDHSVFLAHVVAEDRKMVEEKMQEALSGIADGEFNTEYRAVVAKDQKQRWIKSKGKAYFNAKNEATRFIGTVLDVSGEKTEEENTRELLLRKDEFISIASHELKTPITSLKAALQLLERMKDNPSPTMFPILLAQSTKSMEKVTSLIDDLLNVTRLNEGQIHLNKSTFNIAELLNACCTHVRADGKHEIIVQGDEDIEVFADENRIDQVIVNFVNNAVKYAPLSKNIYLLIEKENGMTKVSIKDGGPGIPEEKTRHLFDRYYRTDYEGGQYSGLGLGLYICSEIIKRHGGNIGVDSVVGQGSSFWFTLP